MQSELKNYFTSTIDLFWNEKPVRKPFEVKVALQTAYRIDEIQSVYFVLNNFDQLFDLINLDLIGLIHEMHRQEEKAPAHPC